MTVIGHDFGNRIARTLASDHAALVKELILLSAGGMVPRAPEMEKLTTRFWETALSPEDRLKAIGQIFFSPGNDPRAWEQGWYFDVARAQRASDARTPLEEWQTGGSAPMLVVQCTEDVIAVPANAKKLKAEFPDRVTVVEIPRCSSRFDFLRDPTEKFASLLFKCLATSFPTCPVTPNTSGLLEPVHLKSPFSKPVPAPSANYAAISGTRLMLLAMRATRSYDSIRSLCS